MSAEFLDRLASQLKIGRDPVSRRAIERILDLIKKGYESGQYQNPTEAERAFRQMVEGAKGERLSFLSSKPKRITNCLEHRPLMVGSQDAVPIEEGWRFHICPTYPCRPTDR